MTPSPILLSIIIPVYNDQPGLDSCLTSLQKQIGNRTDIEIIVVDNASAQKISIPSQNKKNIRLIICGKLGSYAARNAGAKEAKGELLAFIDADCTPEEKWLDNTIYNLSNKSNFIFGGEIKFHKPDPPTGIGLYQYIVTFQQRENIEFKCFTATANLFCLRNTFFTIGLFNEDLLSGGDREWSWRAINKGYTIVYSNNTCVLTTPRVSLKKAIRQARRVAGGRIALKKIITDKETRQYIQPHKSPLSALSWILQHRELSIIEKLKVILAAVIIRLSTLLEILRLKLGYTAEHR